MSATALHSCRNVLLWIPSSTDWSPWTQESAAGRHYHLRNTCPGIHKTPSGSGPDLQGTYEGLGTKEVLEYLRSLGVTSVELLPIHTFINDSHLLEKGLTNYWGYNSIGF